MSLSDLVHSSLSIFFGAHVLSSANKRLEELATTSVTLRVCSEALRSIFDGVAAMNGRIQLLIWVTKGRNEAGWCGSSPTKACRTIETSFQSSFDESTFRHAEMRVGKTGVVISLTSDW